MVLWIAVKEGTMRYLALSLALLAIISVPQAQETKLTGSALIDQQISKTWVDAGAQVAGMSTDAEFLRRASLDILGLLPSPEETLEFINDPKPGKRAAKIDQILARPEYAQAWAEIWDNLLLGYDDKTRSDSKRALYGWLKDEVFTKNLPYDKMVHAL